MLVLTRKPTQRITIGEEISIVVVSIRHDQVRLGIDAPPEMPVMRAELPPEVRECLARRRGGGQ